MERYRTTIILAVLLVALAAVALFLQSPGSVGTDVSATPTPTTNLWGHSSADAITAIDVFSGTQHVGVRSDVTGTTTTWLLVAPTQAEADAVNVTNIVDQLKAMQPTSTFTGTTDLAAYGLDQPRWKITLKYEGASPDKPTLLVGNQTPDVVNYYVKLEGKDDVYVVSTYTVDPMKGWLDNPPIALPTPTPLQLTVLPADTPTTTSAVPTETPAASVATATLPPATAAPSPTK